MIPPFILFIRKNLKIAQLREAQIKRWSRAKKEALIAGDFNKLNQLAKPRSGKKGREGRVFSQRDSSPSR
jgi:hypothetical protein